LLCGIEQVHKLNLAAEEKKPAGTVEIGVTPFGFGSTLKDQEDNLRMHVAESLKKRKEEEDAQFQNKKAELQTQHSDYQRHLQDLQKRKEELENQLLKITAELQEAHLKQDDLGKKQAQLQQEHEQQQLQNEQMLKKQEQQRQERQQSLKPVYRSWNSAKHDHSYNTTVADIGSVKDGYISEGPAFHVLPAEAPGTVPVHSYFNSSTNDHFYTTNASEVGTSTKGQSGNGFTCEGVLGYISSDPVVGTFPVYRYWNQKESDHFYTTHPEEIGTVISGASGHLGYVCEGILGHAFLSPEKK